MKNKPIKQFIFINVTEGSIHALFCRLGLHQIYIEREVVETSPFRLVDKKYCNYCPFEKEVNSLNQ